MTVVTQVDAIGDKLANVSENEEIEVSFNHTLTTQAKVLGVDESVETADREVLLELEDGNRVVAYLQKLQETPRGELNHYENECYILDEDGKTTEEFGEITKIQ